MLCDDGPTFYMASTCFGFIKRIYLLIEPLYYIGNLLFLNFWAWEWEKEFLNKLVPVWVSDGALNEAFKDSRFLSYISVALMKGFKYYKFKNI